MKRLLPAASIFLFAISVCNAVLLVGTQVSQQTARSLSQYGVTWTFDREYQVGQFATGDWWVVGPVRIVDITPRSVTKDGVTRHGSMINPTPSRSVSGGQGWDSRVNTYPSGGVPYNASLNVASAFPIVVPNQSSLLSAVSFDPDRPPGVNDHYPYLKSIAILTVLAEPPAAGSFRPPYVGSNKAIPPGWTVSNIDYARLNRVAPLATTPSLDTVSRYAVEPQIEIILEWPGRYIHPADNYEPARFPGGNPNYGQSIANTYGAMLLSANMNYTTQQKAPIVQRLIQIGIDVYGAATTAAPDSSSGLVWSSNGGHNHGRKMPMLFAGLLLNDKNMIRLANHANHAIFQEDSQFFYISAKDIAIAHSTCCNRPVENYTTADLGLPEWGLDHLGHPQNDNRLWGASYRDIVGSSLLSHVLAAKLMGATEYWSHSALFDYFDQRFYPIERARAGATNGIEVYVRDLWDAYHDIPSLEPVAPRSLRLVQ